MSDWISVKDQLPTPQTKVTCSGRVLRKEEENYYVGVGEYLNGFWIVGGNFDFDIGNVEYWKHLEDSVPEEYKNLKLK